MKDFEPSLLSRTRTLLLIVGVILVACIGSPVKAEKTKVVVLPIDFEMYVLTAAMTREPQPQWVAQGHDFIEAALQRNVAEHFELLAMPSLSAEEEAVLAEHLALYDVAVRNSHSMIHTGGMKHKVDNYDYTLGDGLAWLAEKTAAEKLVMYTAVQERTSGGRKVMTALSLAAVVTTGIYLVPDLGGSYEMVGVIDIASGNIEWANVRRPRLSDLRDEEGAQESTGALFRDFPNGQLMRANVEFNR